MPPAFVENPSLRFRAHSRGATVRIFLTLMLALPGAGCQRERTSPSVATTRGPVIVISIDTLRSDHLPAYGYKGIVTPAIDALRADSVLFSRAYSQCPLTLPSHATLLTGLLPQDNGIRDNAGFRLKDGIETLPAALKKQGYETGAAISTYALRSATGISRGFDFYDDRLAPGVTHSLISDIQRPGPATEQIAEKWIDARASPKFFLFLHLYEPHTPYAPPEPFKSRYESAYDGEIAYVDTIVGTFIQALKKRGLYDDATIILLSDHGEGLGEHGEDEHGILLYRETLQVPLLLKLPKSASRNTTVDNPVQLIDVFPTIAALTGATTANLPGTSLLKAPPDRNIISETYFARLHLGWNDLHSAINGRHHLIRGSRADLFDVVADPGETKPLTPADNRRPYVALDAALEPFAKPIQVDQQVTPEEKQKLAALGYIGTAAPSSGPLPDPRDRIRDVGEIKRAWELYQSGSNQAALTAAKSLLARNPNMVDLLELQANALGGLGRNEEAVAVARHGLELYPGSQDFPLLIADLSMEAGNVAQAKTYAQLATSSRPAEAHDVLARVALAAGDTRTASMERDRAFAAPDPSAMTHWRLGRLDLALGNPATALVELEKAAAIVQSTGGRLRNLHHDRGVALISSGREAEAEEEFKEEIRLYPDETYAYRNLIIFYITHHRLDESTHVIQTLLARPDGSGYAVVVQALMATGNKPGAQRVLHEGVQRYPDDATLRKLLQQ